MKYALLSLMLVFGLKLPCRGGEQWTGGFTITKEQWAAAKKQTVQVLATLRPDARTTAKRETVSGCEVLFGELFEPGHVHAVVELMSEANSPIGVAIATWQVDRWLYQDALPIHAVWRSPSIPKEEAPFLPEKLPDEPFWTQKLGQGDPPLLIVSVDHSRYQNGHFVFLYDQVQHRVQTPGYFSVSAPSRRGNYWVMTNNSGRKSWWSEESFFTATPSGLKFQGSLRTGSYNGDDGHVYIGFIDPTTKREVVWRFECRSDAQEKWIATQRDESDPLATELGEVTAVADPDAFAAFAFNRLTGLPATLAIRELWNEKGELKGLNPVSQGSIKVSVTGSEALRHRFEPTK